ncbi:MAG: hypothetical protein ACLQBB_03440 [Solirubrobacteraceae bacterium]
MHDSAVFAEPGGPTIRVFRRRVVTPGPGRTVARASLPGLLDTRLVQAELVRMRAMRPTTMVDWGRAKGGRSGTEHDARRAS